MKHDDKTEDIKKALLEDIAKGCDEEVVARARDFFEGWESCTTAVPSLPDLQEGALFTASINTNEDVKRLTTVNALAVLAMLVVAVSAIVVRK